MKSIRILNYIKNKLYGLLRTIFWKFILIRNRIKLRNKKFSIICSTCVGGVIYHRLGEKFLSSTINLWISDKDLIKMTKNLRYYMSLNLDFINTGFNYPVAELGDILIHFNHARNREEAEMLWNRRKERINYDNVWVIASDRGLDEKDVEDFGKLSVKGKVLFSSHEYSGKDFVFVFEPYRGEKQCGIYMNEPKSPILNRYFFEQYFDYLKWINTGSVH